MRNLEQYTLRQSRMQVILAECIVSATCRRLGTASEQEGKQRRSQDIVVFVPTGTCDPCNRVVRAHGE